MSMYEFVSKQLRCDSLKKNDQKCLTICKLVVYLNNDKARLCSSLIPFIPPNIFHLCLASNDAVI